MKYQITCDNCGMQFLIDAEPGKTIECQCPECHGVMQITLPNAAKGEHYTPPKPTNSGRRAPWQADTVDEGSHPNRRWLWIGLAVVLVVVCVIGFAMYNTSKTQPNEPDNIPVDTIPYEEPVVDTTPPLKVDTFVEQPEVTTEPEPEVEEAPEENTNQPASEDTTQVQDGGSGSPNHISGHGGSTE